MWGDKARQEVVNPNRQKALDKLSSLVGEDWVPPRRLRELEKEIETAQGISSGLLRKRNSLSGQIIRLEGELRRALGDGPVNEALEKVFKRF